jgi:nucleotide-binding universal stress UspA family protein
MTTPGTPVVVGVGPHGSDAALTFAAAEVRRTQRPLHLVHVLTAGETYAGTYDDLLDHARTTLEKALQAARTLTGDGVPVTTQLVEDGWVVEDLVRRSADAALLVLQHRSMGPVRRAAVGSVVHQVAGRARSPVVSVPEGWLPRGGESPVVTACVKDAAGAPTLLRATFEEARVRKADLTVLHAWWLATDHDVVVVDPALRDDWSARSREEITPVLEALEREFVGVEVGVEVRHAPPVHAVLDAARRSDLLVLGRRHHLLPLGSHLGPVARAALDRATCPVLMTPQDA